MSPGTQIAAWIFLSCTLGVSLAARCPEAVGSYEVAVQKHRLTSAQISRAKTLLEDCGYAVLSGLMDADLLRHVHSELFSFLEGPLRSSYETPLHGSGRDEVGLPFRAPFNSAELVADEGVMAVLRAILGPQFKLEHISVINALPGATAQPYHKDWPALFESTTASVQTPSFAIKVSIPLVDVDPSMGPTEVCPGTHRHDSTGRGHGSGCSRPLAFPSRLGDVVMYDYSVDHRGPPNRSNSQRPVLDLTYSLPFFVDAARPVPSPEKWQAQLKYWQLFQLRPDQPGGLAARLPPLRYPRTGAMKEVKATMSSRSEVQTEQELRAMRMAELRKLLQGYGRAGCAECTEKQDWVRAVLAAQQQERTNSNAQRVDL